MHKIFISHTRDSYEYARNLGAELKSFADVAVMDETEAIRGESIQNLIKRKLQASDVVIVLLTEGAAESPWVMFEIGAALGLGKRILPVLMGDLDHDKIDYLIRDQQYLDARLLNPTQTAKEIIRSAHLAD
jgi:nucleoside 2-deoxyribosyltransferase